ncbi:MAG TPA: hypothetical protein PKY01_19340, partial [Candidatus Hydrogenedentes bacterium]|nr:hypothetical protein [Candidatus Hydrogenedentota bacterium]
MSAPGAPRARGKECGRGGEATLALGDPGETTPERRLANLAQTAGRGPGLARTREPVALFGLNQLGS